MQNPIKILVATLSLLVTSCSPGQLAQVADDAGVVYEDAVAFAAKVRDFRSAVREECRGVVREYISTLQDRAFAVKTDEKPDWSLYARLMAHRAALIDASLPALATVQIIQAKRALVDETGKALGEPFPINCLKGFKGEEFETPPADVPVS